MTKAMLWLALFTASVLGCSGSDSDDSGAGGTGGGSGGSSGAGASGGSGGSTDERMHCHYGNRCLEIATATNAVPQFQESCENGGDQFAFGPCALDGMAGVCSEETGSGLVKNYYGATLAQVMEPSCPGTWEDL